MFFCGLCNDNLRKDFHGEDDLEARLENTEPRGHRDMSGCIVLALTRMEQKSHYIHHSEKVSAYSSVSLWCGCLRLFPGIHEIKRFHVSHQLDFCAIFSYSFIHFQAYTEHHLRLRTAVNTSD